LTADVTDYNIQDRPPITAVTAATPPVVTSAAHGLADGDIINVRDVQGTNGINGRRKITYIGASSFSLKEFFRITGLTYDTSTGLASVTTDEPHGWSTGNTITLADTGDANLNGAFSITVTGARTFTYTPTLAPDSDFAYAGDGYCTKSATGTGTWTSGGRYWKENEIPTHIENFRYALRTYNAFTRKIEFVSNSELVEAANVNYTTLNYGSYYAPTMAVHTRVAGLRIVRFYPIPPDVQDVKLYGVVSIAPHLYFADPVTAVIHLESEYNVLIKQYLKSRAYAFMNKRDEAKEELGMFYAEMKEKQMYRQMKGKIAVTYR
jgi:hypothetical protein